MIFIGSDHRGFLLKEEIKKYLENKSMKYMDLGTNSEESVNYPDFAKSVCLGVKEQEENRGILICGTGIGMSIAANKFKGIRCALCYDKETAKYSKMHNNSNVLALSSKTSVANTLGIIDEWLKTEFEGNRHSKRISIIEEIENENFK